MYKEACVLLKKAGWWDDVKISTKNAWNDFNDYADKHKWVRPAATAAAAGLGGAGIGALFGGGKGAAIGGLTGLIGGGTGGAIWDDMRREQLQRKRYTPDKFIAANLDNMADNLSMTKKLPTDPQQRAIQLQRMKTNFVRDKSKDFLFRNLKNDINDVVNFIPAAIGVQSIRAMRDPVKYARNMINSMTAFNKEMPKEIPTIKAGVGHINKYLYNMFNLAPQEFQQYKKMILNRYK